MFISEDTVKSILNKLDTRTRIWQENVSYFKKDGIAD